MNHPKIVNFTSIVAILFVCSAIPAFAQRGGGGSHGGGGGFHGGGGGGFRSAGAARSGGGFGGNRGGTSSPPRMGAGPARPAPSAPTHTSGESNAKPGGNPYRSNTNPGNGNQRVANPSSGRPATPDGQWHSFGNAAGGAPATSPAQQARSSVNTGGGFHVLPGNTPAGASQATRSFSGQGNQIWENSPAARNVVSSSHALSNIRGSFGNSLAGNSRLRTSATLSASSRISGGTAFGNRASVGLVGSTRIASSGNGFRFGNSFHGYRGGYRRGCWNCGFGWGFGLGWWPGLGFGWPWLGYSYGDPFYWNSGTWGWPGYGYYGYPAGYPYGYDNNYYNDSSSYSAPDNNYTDTDSNSVTSAPLEQNSPQVGGVANVAVPVLLFLQDGSMYAAHDYWFSGDQVHYVLMNGREGAFDADQLDMRRTNEENAKSGVPFVVKSDPSILVPAP